MKLKPLLRPFSFCMIMFMILSINSNAQIVYTDLRRDISLKCDKSGCSKTYSLDLNNDATIDFTIGVSSFPHVVSITPLNGNSIAGPFPLPFSNNVVTASALNENSFIDQSLYWASQYKLLRVFYGWPAVCGEPCLRGFYGEWNTTSDHYLGLKIISNNQTYYGWARLSVSVTEKQASFKLKEYAYESAPDVAILAGNTGATIVARSPDNNDPENTGLNELKLKIAPNPVSGSAKISFSIKQPGTVSLKIYDINGRLIKTLADAMFAKGIYQLEWNATNMSAGIYILKMQMRKTIQTKKIIIAK